LKKKRLARIPKAYKLLFAEFGPQNWWPGETPFEVIVGAILTQNTAWSNVEKAIANLKRERLLTPARMASVKEKRLSKLIRPAGYHNIKAKRLKNFMGALSREAGGRLDKLLGLPKKALRGKLLAINGIGPETADSILLYAAGKPAFVVDAYTRRVFSRHGIVGEGAAYSEIQAAFVEALPKSVKLFNEYHALIVALAKRHCRKKPGCEACPLHNL